jgi:hypothetical protein
MAKKPALVDEFAGMSHLFQPEYEKLILANAMMRTDEGPKRILTELSGDDFSRLKYRKIFSACQELLVAGKFPLISNLAAYFVEKEALQECGLLSFLRA